jgi:hydrogenase-4 component B
MASLSGGLHILYLVAMLLWLAVFLLGACLRRYSGPILPGICLAGCVALLTAALAGGDCELALPAPWFLGVAGFDFTIDPLSRWFLGIIGLIGIPATLFSPGYFRHLRHRVSLGYVWAAMALLLASMAGVVMAANALVFLVAWEVMAFSSFALVATDHEQLNIRRAAFIYLGATRTGTAFLMAGLLWAYYLSGSWSFADWRLSGAEAVAPSLLLLTGLAVKAGCWPFHLWLPVAHPAAPAPVSALMSGVMIKTAVYMMIRLFIMGGAPAVPVLGPLLLLLGAVSAFWGVIFALLQHDLKRLLAYHSVENIGIIAMGLGVSLLGVSYNLPLLAQLGLVAALYHTLNHAVFKSLLFLGTGAVDAQTHLRNVEQLGGLIHRMPWTALSFITGSAAICALPPLNGFASEWLLYQGFFNLAVNGGSIALRLAALLLMGWLALVGALAVACFVKAVGIVFLGVPRTKPAENAREAAASMVAPQVFLALMCAGLGLAFPYVMLPLRSIAAGTGGPDALDGAWLLPVAPLALMLALAVAALMATLQLLSRNHPAKRYKTWDCGFGALSPRMQYTATSFAQPVSRLFGTLYGYGTRTSRTGEHSLEFPEAIEAETMHEAYLETRLYQPFIRGLSRAAGVFVMRLQAGSIHQYLLYMALVAAALLVAVMR